MHSDELKYAHSLIGSFTKGLSHNGVGEADTEQFRRMVRVLNSETYSGFDYLPQQGICPFVNPQAGLVREKNGIVPRTMTMPEAPAVDSAEIAADMVELYWMSLLRDVPFLYWEDGAYSTVNAATQEITELEAFAGPKEGDRVTPRTLFRGGEKGCDDGPYLSQFLLRDIPLGTLTVSQRQRTVVPDRNYMTQWDEYLAIQNGSDRWASDPFDATPRYIRSLRDLGQAVRGDTIGQPYVNACSILLQDRTALDSGNPYGEHKNLSTYPYAQRGGGTFGPAHISGLIAQATTEALRAVWWQKWFVHRRLRPERYGALVETQDLRDYPIPGHVMESDAARRVKDTYSSYLLPMQYPEGAPLHPSYGAGHAAVAGACVTLLKAWFDESASLRQSPVVADAEGIALVPYTSPDAHRLTVGGELNKLGANLALARCAAGVQWRSDCRASLQLGEQIAVNLLVAQSGDFNEAFSLTFTSFSGRQVRVTGGPHHTMGGAFYVDTGTPYPLPGQVGDFSLK